MASSYSKRRWVNLRNPAVVDVRCSCRKSKLLSSLFSSSSSAAACNSKQPKPNPHSPAKHHHPLSSYYPFSPPSTTTTFSTTTSSSSLRDDYPTAPPPPKPKARRVAKESVAVVKESRDPYHDFRDSMLQMVVEKEIYSTDDLRDLLHRFLSLNSPYHHDAILRAFSEIWSSLFSADSEKRRPVSQHRRRRHHQQHRRRSSRELPFLHE